MNNIKHYKNMSDDDYHKFYLENRQVQYEQELEEAEQENEKFENLVNKGTVIFFIVLFVICFFINLFSK